MWETLQDGVIVTVERCTVTFLMTLSDLRRSFRICCVNSCAQLTRDLLAIATILVAYLTVSVEFISAHKCLKRWIEEVMIITVNNSRIASK